jgi:hypothetical protein
MPVPVFHRGGSLSGGDVEVGDEERVAVDGVGVGELGDRQCPLVGVQGAASSRPRVGADLARRQPDPANQQPGRRRPPVRTVVGHRDLRAVHVDPVALGDTIEDPPQWGDALGADRELHTGHQRAARASAPAKYPASARSSTRPRPHRRRQRRQCTTQQASGMAAGILVPAIRSAASAVQVWAQVATCGRPQRCPK